MSSHLAAFAVFVGIPFANIFGPLVIWLLKKDEYEIVDRHGIEAMNFQISMTIYMLISGFLCFAFIGFLLLPLVLILDVIFVIKATIHASKGEFFEYPMNLRFIK